MSAASISKIHVSNSTRLSLNDRFTAIHSVQPEQRRRSRSRSISRNLAPVDRGASLANRRLLQQLARRHKMQAALKLKRRSMRPTGNGIAMKRGSIKAIRVAANGRPIRANTLTNVATMKADFVTNGNSRKPFRRSNSMSNISSGRLGSRRPVVGGAAQRVARRRQDRVVGSGGSANQRPARGGRSRSRSRARLPNTGAAVGNTRGRSLSRTRAGGNLRGRSLSRGRPVPDVRGGPRGRSRSRSRGRGRIEAGARSSLPIKARLGVRPRNNTATTRGDNRRNQLRGNASGRPNRNASISRRGVAQGRVQKRRNSVAQSIAVGGGNRQRAGGVGGRVGRSRGRSATGNLVGRVRSQTRKGIVGQQQQRSASTDRNGRPGGRGRSQQRNGGSFRRGGLGGGAQRNGKANGQQQQRRGRSRSRAGGRGRGVGRGGNQGKNGSPQVNKDALDKELDQYMATTKTENDMDYLLKN